MSTYGRWCHLPQSESCPPTALRVDQILFFGPRGLYWTSRKYGDNQGQREAVWSYAEGWWMAHGAVSCRARVSIRVDDPIMFFDPLDSYWTSSESGAHVVIIEDKNRGVGLILKAGGSQMVPSPAERELPSPNSHSRIKSSFPVL